MRVSENIADELTREIASRYQYFSNPEKQKIKRLIVRAIEPLEAPINLNLFDPNSANAANHRSKILTKLKKAKRAGQTTADLGAICFGYRARITELRHQGFKIGCTRLNAQSFLYRLSPEFWPEAK